MGCFSSSSGIELYGFSDASQNALGAVFYLRTLHDFADATVVLITAKSKVAPIKKQTIPRLEFSSVVLLARLLSRVRRILGYQYVPAHLWTDSSVSLAWIQGHSSRWKKFVSNRVAVIQDLVPTARWHHLWHRQSSRLRNARPLTKSASPAFSLVERAFMAARAFRRMADYRSSSRSVDRSRGTPLTCSLLVSAVSIQTICWDLIDRFSQLNRLLRVTAWIMRAAARFKGSIITIRQR